VATKKIYTSKKIQDVTGMKKISPFRLVLKEATISKILNNKGVFKV